MVFLVCKSECEGAIELLKQFMKMCIHVFSDNIFMTIILFCFELLDVNFTVFVLAQIVIVYILDVPYILALFIVLS